MEVREPSAKYLARPGYKQTKVGVIPQDWEVSTVGAEFEIQLGKMLDAEKNHGVPRRFLGNRSVQWGYIDVTELAEIKLTPSDLQRYRLKAGDLLVCEGGDVGRAAIWKEQLNECYYQKALHRLRPRRDFSVRLMQAILEWKAACGDLQNYVTQTSIAHLPKDKFETVPIPVPATREEQQAIADALGDADALIESLEHLLAKQRLLRQATMQALLTGERRLPGFEGAWCEVALGDIAPLQRGFDLPNGQLRPGPYPVVYSNGVLNHHQSFQVRGPGVVTGRSGTIGAVMYVEGDFWPHNTALWVTSFRGNEPKFVYFLFSFLGLERFATGSGVPTLNRNDVHAFKTLFPPTRAEQTAIATVLSDLDAEIAALEARIAKARLVKQGMMQELLTGRIRLV